MSTTAAVLLTDPLYLPHALDLERNEVLFLHCDPEKVAVAPFIDGRTDIRAGPALSVPIADIIHAQKISASQGRFLFHIGFCGSTLLSRLLDVPDKVRVLREPNILSDLARYRSALDQHKREDRGFRPLVEKICSLLHRAWGENEVVVVKPSNWANNLLYSSLYRLPSTRAIFLVSTRSDFLHAVFRGGADRLAFAARAAVHLTSGNDHYAHILAVALNASGDNLDRLARAAIILHAIQIEYFSVIMTDAGWTEECRLQFSELRSDPVGQAARAARLLDIEVSHDVLEANAVRWADHHAKAPSHLFSAMAEQREDERIRSVQGARIGSALEWANKTLGPER